jgi:hypothetical protein
LNPHLSDLEIERYLAGELPPEAQRRATRHFLRGCSPCTERLSARLPPTPGSPPPTAGELYEQALDRAIADACRRAPQWAVERRQAELAVAQGPAKDAGCPRPERPSPAWVQVLLEQSFAERYRDPRQMLAYALAARDASLQIDAATFGRPLAADWQARAWAELANAHRLGDDFAACERALARAGKLLEGGTGDPLVQARVRTLEASLRADQRRFAEAARLLEENVEIYQILGESHLEGRALVKLAIFSDYAGDPRRGLELVQKGISLLDPEHDPKLQMTATEVLLGLLVENRCYRQALELLDHSDLGARLAGEPMNLLRLRWVEGRIWAGLGRPESARATFEAVRAGFLDAGQEYTAALVGLDLAAVWLAQGETAKVTELARQMLAAFQKAGVEREARHACDFLVEACRREQATPALVEHVYRFLKRLERDPRLRFAAP